MTGRSIIIVDLVDAMAALYFFVFVTDSCSVQLAPQSVRAGTKTDAEHATPAFDSSSRAGGRNGSKTCVWCLRVSRGWDRGVLLSCLIGNVWFQ